MIREIPSPVFVNPMLHISSNSSLASIVLAWHCTCHYNCFYGKLACRRVGVGGGARGLKEGCGMGLLLAVGKGRGEGGKYATAGFLGFLKNKIR